MFDPVDPRQSFPDLERGILQYWKEEDVFKRSVKQHCIPGDVLDHQGQKGRSCFDTRSCVTPSSSEQERGAYRGAGCATPTSALATAGRQHDTFSFYDGPPFATGLPHYGHLLAGTIKDVIPRYQTMRGKRVDRRFGWDCHGLPVENLVEKEEGLKSKKDIEAKGIRWFNDRCRASVQRYTEEWRRTVERTGRWVDMDWDYRTMDPDFMESIWWAFQSLHHKGLIYEGKKSMHVCPRCATPLSNFEVTLGYKDVSDWTTITVFPLVDEPNTALLAWTTTSWTLPGNLFLAVGPSIAYVKVKMEGDERVYIAAEKLVENIFKGKEHQVVGSISAKELIGKKYEPLFPYFAAEYKKQGAFRVVDGDFVTTEEGTGIVHIATGFGDDDYQVGRREGVEVLSHVGMDGRFIPAVTDFAGEEVKPADDPTKTDKKVAAYLKDHGRLFDQFSHTHSYPHCWRCDSPLINYATSSWFVAVEKIKKDLLAQNGKTNWVPAHIRDGRFGQWLENARDWAISRNRYWGTPLPIWRCEETGEIEVLGSRDELMSKCPSRFTKLTVLRHAESVGNLTPIYQGKNPGTDLTARGMGEAEEAARSLRAKPPNAAESRSVLKKFLGWFSMRPSAALLEQNVKVIYASPLARARQTAEIISKRTGAKIIVDERLREVHFGDFEGKTVDFSDLTFVKERRAHKIEKNRPESIYHFDGMETWESVQKRVQKFMEEILPKHRGEHIAIVTHADPVINIRHFFTGESPWKLSHQPYPEKAKPYTYFFDHTEKAQMDLHRETVDELIWVSPKGGTMRRIPDILDCWFESGSMPYAQSHFPFEQGEAISDKRLAVGNGRKSLSLIANRSSLPLGFPADFIAEGLDQTRGWFYTLMVLSTALFKKPAFKNCIVNGIVLAEDGKKMSKRLKNYPEPEIVMDKFGADAMRFTLMSSPAVRGENLRFSEKAVEETVRRVILPLWNAYSFFVLHANEANWQPEMNDRLPLTARHPLDSWIKSELQDLTNRMTHELDAYDLSATCSELYETLDALTNWYVRRSRRRFAGKEGQEEQRIALSTLYDVLITFSKLLAPFCPFITDAIYLNLAPDEHGSIHLTEWPATRALTKMESEEIEKTRLLRAIVSLGMRVRNSRHAKVKVRLALMNVAGVQNISDTEKMLLKEELNLEDIRFFDEVTAFAEAFVQVDARKVGPRLGSKVQEVIRAGKEGKFRQERDGSITILDGLDEVLSPDEASITYRARNNDQADIATQEGIVVQIDFAMQQTNRESFLQADARNIIRSIQATRKQRGLKLSDQITIETVEGGESSDIKWLQDVVEFYGALIEDETHGKFSENMNDVKLHVKFHMDNGKVVIDV